MWLFTLTRTLNNCGRIYIVNHLTATTTCNMCRHTRAIVNVVYQSASSYASDGYAHMRRISDDIVWIWNTTSCGEDIQLKPSTRATEEPKRFLSLKLGRFALNQRMTMIRFSSPQSSTQVTRPYNIGPETLAGPRTKSSIQRPEWEKTNLWLPVTKEPAQHVGLNSC